MKTRAHWEDTWLDSGVSRALPQCPPPPPWRWGEEGGKVLSERALYNRQNYERTMMTSTAVAAARFTHQSHWSTGQRRSQALPSSSFNQWVWHRIAADWTQVERDFIDYVIYLDSQTLFMMSMIVWLDSLTLFMMNVIVWLDLQTLIMMAVIVWLDAQTFFMMTVIMCFDAQTLFMMTLIMWLDSQTLFMMTVIMLLDSQTLFMMTVIMWLDSQTLFMKTVVRLLD